MLPQTASGISLVYEILLGGYWCACTLKLGNIGLFRKFKEWELFLSWKLLCYNDILLYRDSRTIE